MKALTFHGKQKIVVEQVPDPQIIFPTDAVLQLEAVGICGSDLHLYHERELGLDHGTVMGHEAVGRVVEVGKGVTELRVGDRVAVPFTTSCGDCFYCLRGLTCRCLKGELFGWVHGGCGLAGLQAEYARIPLADASVFAVPTDLTADEALLLGDVIPTGIYAADLAEVEPQGVYVVVGCGPIGLMAIAAARERGATTVLAVDAVPERLALARAFGATPLNYRGDDVAGAVMQMTAGRGADAVMEGVGSSSAQDLAFRLVRPGGILATVGVHTTESFAFSPAKAYDKNLTYRVGRCPARANMARACDLVRGKKYPVPSLISHHLNLDDGPRAYQIFDEKREGCTKVVLSPH